MNMPTSIHLLEKTTDSVDNAVQSKAITAVTICNNTGELDGPGLKPEDSSCAKGSRLRSKEGFVQQKSVEKLEGKMLVAYSQLFHQKHDISLSSYKTSGKSVTTELSPAGNEIASSRINSTCSDKILTFRYPRNSHFFVFLKVPGIHENNIFVGM